MTYDWRMDLRRRTAGCVILAVGLIVACAGESPSDPPLENRTTRPAPENRVDPGPSPNVLLIVLDTTRRDRMSTHGYERATTPALDRFAAEGIVYENAISSGSWTLPAHASLFTGMFARDHGTSIENQRLAGSFTTLAEVFRDNGYATGAFTCNPWIAPHTGLDQGFQELHPTWRDFDRENGPDYHGAMMATRDALAWIDDRSSGAPFFLFVNYMEAHAPYRPKGEWREKFLPAGVDPAAVAEVVEWKTPREFGYMLGVPGYEITEAQFDLIDALYDGDVAYQDSRLGELLDGLQERGLSGNTIVAIVADHGEQLGEHGMLEHKMTLYEENIRVPLLLRYPGRVPAGERFDTVVQTHDLFPTLVGLAGVDFDAPYGSRPLPLSESEAGAGRRYTFVEFGRPSEYMDLMRKEWPGTGVELFDRQLKAIRGDRYKLIWATDGRHELYDLQNDPFEQVNLAGEDPELLAELRRRLLSFHAGRLDMIDRAP
jgi:arylsulfatase A-like enzyme